MKLLVTILISMMVIFVSCSKGEKTDTTPGQTTGTVLAKVNNHTLTMEDLLSQFPPESRDQVLGENLPKMIDTWISTQLLYEKGVELGLDKDPEVQAAIKFSTSEAVASKFVNSEVINKINVTPATVDSVYAIQKNSFRLDKERFRASHIMVESETDANAIYNRLKKGDDFGKLAMDLSKDRRSAEVGGDIGYFTLDQIPIFADALTNLKIGEYSKPFKSQYGYHLLKLTDRQAAGAPMDSLEVKQTLADSLTKEKRAAYLDSVIADLKSKAKIERPPLPGSAPTAQ